MKYEIYRTIKVGGELIDTLIAITFTEETAKEIVKGIRKSMGNQLAYYTEEQKNEN